MKIGAESGGMTVVTAGPRAERARGDQQSISPAARHAGARQRRGVRRRRGQDRGAGQVIMSISEPFVRRPIATSLLMGGIFLVGLVVFPLLPVAPLPQVDFPTIQVTAQLPGASPETMASSVAHAAGIPVRGNLRAVADDLDQRARHHADHAAVRPGPQHRCGRAGRADRHRRRRRPAAEEPADAADLPQGQSGRFADSDPGGALRRAAGHHRRRLRREHPRAADLADSRHRAGDRSAASRSRRCACRSIRPSSPRSACRWRTWPASSRTATVDAPKGSINGPTRSMTIYDNDQLLKAAPWNDVVVAYKNGAPVRIRDIGVAVDGPENTLMTAWQNGHNGILLLIYKQPGANVIDAVAARRRRCCRMRSPRCRRRSKSTRSPIAPPPSRPRCATWNSRWLLTIALVVMVIFLFLRNAWATIIPGVTVPLALLGTAAMMYVLDYSLDNLSLMALTIAVGFVVDDAIVMLENIYRHIEAGLIAPGGDAQGRRRDRLHHHVDQHLAGRGIHSAAADGRHHRPAVPRIRDHHDDDHRRLGLRRADALADDVRAVPARREARQARQGLHGDRAGFRQACWPGIRAAWTSCWTTSARP